MFVGTVIFCQIYLYRCVSTSRERQQTKWVLFGIVISLVGVLTLTFVYIPSDLYEVANDSLWFIFLLALPLSIGVAMLRDHLWDIDIILNRTLVYGALTACLVGMYALLVGGLS